MTLTCHGCGDTFATDPRLGPACPECGANPGTPCKRPSEHQAPEPHAARKRLAFELNPCRCLANWEAAQPLTLAL